MRKTEVHFLPAFFLSMAAAILLIPLPWLIAWILAAFVHELFHIAAVLLFRHSIISVYIGGGGAILESDLPDGIKMSVCALMGPLGGLIIFLFLHVAPRVAICGLIQSLYNLLPLCHLDGGRALHGVLSSLFMPKTVNLICAVIERVILYLMVAAALYALLILKLGLIPLAFVSVLLFKNKKSLAMKAA